MARQILQASNQKLRRKARPVEKIDAKIKEMVKEMKQVLKRDNSALALAAPQLGINKQIAVIKKWQDKNRGISIPSLVLINPKIIEKSAEQVSEEEGCLSLKEPEIRGQVSRARQVRIKYQDLAGNKKELKADNLLARVLQHEIDHLKGWLFIDRANPASIYQVTEQENLNGKKI